MPEPYKPTIQLLRIYPPSLNQAQAKIINRLNAQNIIRPILSQKEIRELNDLNLVPEVPLSDSRLEEIEGSKEFQQSKLPNVYNDAQIDYYRTTGEIPEGKKLTKLMKIQEGKQYV